MFKSDKIVTKGKGILTKSLVAALILVATLPVTTFAAEKKSILKEINNLHNVTGVVKVEADVTLDEKTKNEIKTRMDEGVKTKIGNKKFNYKFNSDIKYISSEKDGKTNLDSEVKTTFTTNDKDISKEKLDQLN